MSITEFIKEEVQRRAEAAAKLKDELKINSISISYGCSDEGIAIDTGIEELAKIVGKEITVSYEPLKYREDEVKRIEWFMFGKTRFYHYNIVSAAEGSGENASL